jgi:hypothetical protein
MYPLEWKCFLNAVREMQLPRSCNLRMVQAQLHRIYQANKITPSQWAEFESVVHQLEPALPWRD